MAKWVSERETCSNSEVLDVYRSASVTEFRKAGKLLEGLVTRTKEVLERWPEVVTLKLILDCVKVFLNSPITTSHVKMSTLLENVLGIPLLFLQYLCKRSRTMRRMGETCRSG